MTERRQPDLRSGPAGDFGSVLRKRARGERVMFESAVDEPIETWRPPERKRSLIDRVLFGRRVRRMRRAAPPSVALPLPTRLTLRRAWLRVRVGGRRRFLWLRLARRRRQSLLTASAVPALVAAVAGAFVAPLFGGGDDRRGGPESAIAADLARAAGAPGSAPRLVPVVDRDGRPELARHATGTGAVSRPSPPARISIPRARVDAPIDSVGATADGLVLPDLGRVGWWAGGPRPGEDGRAVIVGHLDSKDRPDVFARVPELAKDDRIVVRDAAGDAHEYEVVGVTRVPKAEFPKEDVYGPARRPVLVLVTCGGPYDPALGHYRDNVLVYARGV